MPLPNDERLIALSEEILKQLEAMFGSHPGFRPVHAKGILLRAMSSLLVIGPAEGNRITQILAAINYRFVGPNSR